MDRIGFLHMAEHSALNRDVLCLFGNAPYLGRANPCAQPAMCAGSPASWTSIFGRLSVGQMSTAAFAKAGWQQRPKAGMMKGRFCAQLNTSGLPMPRPRPRSSAWDGSTSAWRIRSADSGEPPSAQVHMMGPEHRRKDLASLRREIVQDARLRHKQQQDVMGHEPNDANNDGTMDSLLDGLPRSPLIEDACLDSDW